MIRKLIKNVILSTINRLDCLVAGHAPFETGDSKVLRLIQPRSVGNETREVHICKRCNQFYAVVGELSPQELAAEAAYIRKQEQLKEELLSQTEEYLKRFAEQAVEKDGKSALN